MPCRRNLSTETVYKDAVVIGNGPSAISLSYMLAGNVAFYDGTSNDEMLHARLSQEKGSPLVLQDLQLIADGLEGRSTNPVSVLFDALNHPEADAGFEQPPLLSWSYRPELGLDHVVLGKGKAGGAWKKMSDNNLLTVSFGSWMELPNLKMCEWKPALSDGSEKRVTVSTVANYYQDYVRLMSLEKYFEDHSVVTSVRKITEFSASDCLSMAKRESCHDFEEDDPLFAADIVSLEHAKLEDNAIFEHESTLYNEEYFSEGIKQVSVLTKDRQHSNSGTADDDDLTGELGGGAISWEDGDSIFSSNIASTSPSVGNAQDPIEESDDFTFDLDQSAIRHRALSGTRLGQMMQTRAQRISKISCCLELSKFCCPEDNDFYNLSWNPIVHPTFFSASLPKCSESVRTRSYSWSNLSQNGSPKSHTVCPVSRCFPKVSHIWEVSGFRTIYGNNGEECREEFRYLTKNVVLATGSYDRPNVMSVPGENYPFVFHSIGSIEEILTSKKSHSNSDPIMIVGAGLSAADAIITALHEGLKVIHVFRRDANDRSLIFNNLPKTLYPEYQKVHRLMRSMEKDDLYRPMEKHHVVKIMEDRQVKLHGELSCSIVKVSKIIVLVGSKPNLDFLDETCGNEGKGLGILPGQPIGRNNPIDIDLFTHESIRQSGLYAMGPLVGDNFVRFLQGGALAITSNILKTQKQTKFADATREAI